MIQPKVAKVHLAMEGLKRGRWFSIEVGCEPPRLDTLNIHIRRYTYIIYIRIFAPIIKVFTYQSCMRATKIGLMKYSLQEIYQMTEYLRQILKFSHIKVMCVPTKIGLMKYSHQEIYPMTKYLDQISHIKKMNPSRLDKLNVQFGAIRMFTFITINLKIRTFAKQII